MSRLRSFRAVVVLVALSFVATACSTSSESKTSSSTGTSTAPPAMSVVALGDSVPRGTNCDCRPYPPLTADGLTASSGQMVTAVNDSVAGSTTSNVMHQITTNGDVIAHLRAADAVEIEVGANDVAYTKSCATYVDCYASRIPTIDKNLTAIVGRVHELASSRTTATTRTRPVTSRSPRPRRR